MSKGAPYRPRELTVGAAKDVEWEGWSLHHVVDDLPPEPDRESIAG